MCCTVQVSLLMQVLDTTVQQQPIKGAQKGMIYSWFYEKIEATQAMCV